MKEKIRFPAEGGLSITYSVITVRYLEDTITI